MATFSPVIVCVPTLTLPKVPYPSDRPNPLKINDLPTTQCPIVLVFCSSRIQAVVLPFLPSNYASALGKFPSAYVTLKFSSVTALLGFLVQAVVCLLCYETLWVQELSLNPETSDSWADSFFTTFTAAATPLFTVALFEDKPSVSFIRPPAV